MPLLLPPGSEQTPAPLAAAAPRAGLAPQSLSAGRRTRRRCGPAQQLSAGAPPPSAEPATVTTALSALSTAGLQVTRTRQQLGPQVSQC